MKIKKMLKDILSEEQLYQLQRLDGSIRQNIKKVLPEELMLKRLFKKRMGYPLDLENPQTFNEKLQWLKLHDRNPLYTTMVDKYEVKKYVADKIGEQYIIPTLGVWNHFDEIDFDELPNKFVLKCTHDSGSVVLCKDKSTFDKTDAKRKLERGLARNYYYMGYEWPYKDVKPRIIAEKYMEDESINKSEKNNDLTDYKLMCFDGEVYCTFTCTDRHSSEGLKVTFFDNDWNKLPFERHYPSSDRNIEEPKNFQKMKDLAEILSENIPFVRVDFYEIIGNIYFGELTFYPGTGMEEFNLVEWDKKLGDKIHIEQLSAGGTVFISDDGFVLWIHQEIRGNAVDKGLIDYKFYCFNGEPKFLYVSQGLGGDHSLAKMNFLDMDWKKTPFQRHDFMEFTDDEFPIKPMHWNEMVEFAKLFSKYIPFLRVDMYEIGGKVYISEFTFYPGCGYTPFSPDKWEKEIGNWIELPNKKM